MKDITPEHFDDHTNERLAFQGHLDVPEVKPGMVIYCPNHHVPLEVPFPLTREGVGRCPHSGQSLEYRLEWDEDEVAKQKDGSLTKKTKWIVDKD